ncbi:MAG TPA: hypothetical protein VM759_07360 [Longimicrobium sp.]|nr:hypothetical protein [Longimicrobium sp.]
MKKLTLKADDLKVLSFETAPVRGRAGTVHGAANTTPNCPQWSEFWTCGIWCPETTDPEVTGPCNCPVDTQAPVC